VSLAGEQTLPVLSGLDVLLTRGLRRGITVTLGGVGGVRSLGLALGAAPSAAGSWVGAVGLPSLGLVAAAEAGISLERLMLVADPPASSWATVIVTLLDAMDVVLARPVGRVRGSDGRRIAARARERGAVLVLAGGADLWPLPADLTFTVTAASWQGVGEGHGHLRARRAEVTAFGRGADARERRAILWLPGPDGRVAVAHTIAAEPIAAERIAEVSEGLRDAG